MNTVTLIGIDFGKHCFHLHGQDAQGRMIFRKKLSRSQLLTQLANFPVCRVVVRDRTSTINQIHAFLLEFGISLPKGPAIIKRLPAVLAEHEVALPHRLIAVIEPPRIGRSPKTGEKVSIPAKWTPHFKAGTEMRERVDGV